MGNGDNAAHEYSMHTMFSLVATPYLPTLNTGNARTSLWGDLTLQLDYGTAHN